LYSKYQPVYQIEMGRACGMYEGEKRSIKGFGGEAGGKGTIWKT
jgi:uncharacterized spore protein YtfJ